MELFVVPGPPTPDRIENPPWTASISCFVVAWWPLTAPQPHSILFLTRWRRNAAPLKLKVVFEHTILHPGITAPEEASAAVGVCCAVLRASRVSEARRDAGKDSVMTGPWRARSPPWFTQ